jgi:Icc-related predicted phosphoesterase
VIRVAAVGDVHAGADSVGAFRHDFAHLADQADLLVLAGDLTRVGDPAEAAVLVAEIRDLAVPVVAVLGNHDYHADAATEIGDLLEAAGVRVLEGSGATFEVDGVRVGVAGTKGFGGGFAGASGSEFGEPEMKTFIRRTKAMAERLERALDALESETDLRIALLHYAPIPETLHGEPVAIYPFLGSYLLGEAIDRSGADLVCHGHAHRGSEQGATPGGIPVRNVARPVLRRAYGLYCLDGDRQPIAAGAASEQARE